MTMREKMARAIAMRIDHTPWEQMTLTYQSVYWDCADAALAALEEPTEAMVSDGWDAFQSDATIVGVWRAMLGAVHKP